MAEYKTREQKQKFYNSPEWKRLRKVILEINNYECQECAKQGVVTIDTNEYSKTAKRKKIQLVVDYVKDLEHHPELVLKSNLIIMCVRCHNIKHNRHFEFKKKFIGMMNGGTNPPPFRVEGFYFGWGPVAAPTL